MEACIFVAVLALVGGGAFGLYLGLRVLRLRREYAAALADLKADPTNPALRERALSIGRAYAEADQSSGTFSEMHLMNDISTACAHAASVPPAARTEAFEQTQSAPRLSIEQRLARVESLRDAGHISEEECRERRREILAEV